MLWKRRYLIQQPKLLHIDNYFYSNSSVIDSIVEYLHYYINIYKCNDCYRYMGVCMVNCCFKVEEEVTKGKLYKFFMAGSISYISLISCMGLCNNTIHLGHNILWIIWILWSHRWMHAGMFIQMLIFMLWCWHWILVHHLY